METKKQILNTKDSVSLHVRRGDYLNYDNIFINLGSGYYNGALNALYKRLKNAHIFVFSNDISWCEKHLLEHIDSKFKQSFSFSFINNNSEINAAFELELMKNCKHNIIANSTFSWWAAYLNENPQKIVIAPNKFLSITPDDAYKDHEDKIYKKEWIRIDYVWGDEI